MKPDDELDRLQELANYWELMYLRSKEGAQAANRGIARLRAGRIDLELDLADARAQNERLRRENAELEKKIQRLSLMLLGEWGKR